MKLDTPMTMGGCGGFFLDRKFDEGDFILMRRICMENFRNVNVVLGGRELVE